MLLTARRRGFLGPGPVEAHIDHARAFLPHWRCEGGEDPRWSLDLGSGGGIPGLVLACDRPGTTWVLLDANATRTAFLAAATAELGLAHRVSVVTARAEELGRDPGHRRRYARVVARAFARPAVVAECAAPLLEVGGLLLVSEPPEGHGRWPRDELEQLGLVVVEAEVSTPRIAVLGQRHPCPERFPRRVGIPAKRPLW